MDFSCLYFFAPEQNRGGAGRLNKAAERGRSPPADGGATGAQATPKGQGGGEPQRRSAGENTAARAPRRKPREAAEGKACGSAASKQGRGAPQPERRARSQPTPTRAAIGEQEPRREGRPKKRRDAGNAQRQQQRADGRRFGFATSQSGERAHLFSRSAPEGTQGNAAANGPAQQPKRAAPRQAPERMSLLAEARPKGRKAKRVRRPQK